MSASPTKPAKPASQVFVHLLLEDFREACRGQTVEGLVALSEALDAILARRGSRWRRPSASEAALAGNPPWLHTGKAGSPLEWGTSLRREIADELRLESSIGIASSELAARMCARLARPRGVLVWMPGRERELLQGAPLESLDELSPEQISRLRSEGIRTLDAVSALEPSRTRALLGVDGKRLLDLVRHGGIALGDLEKSKEAEEDSGRHRGALALLAKRLSRRLEREGLRARGIELAVGYRNGVIRESHVPLPEPTASSEEIERAALRLYRREARVASPVVGVSLTATGIARADQLDLFRSPAERRDVRVGVGAL